MARPDTITAAQLSRIIGTPDAPAIVDVRVGDDHASDPRMIPASVRRDHRTIWVTRARPKIGRIACPWLIRRFIDPAAVFLFVAPSEVAAVADWFRATAFDIEDVFWSHRGELCTFDVMLDEFNRHCEALVRLGTRD